MTESLITAIFTLWQQLMNTHPEYGVGQALFNAVSALDSDLAERLRQESHCNPYYVNARVGAAIKWLYEQEARWIGWLVVPIVVAVYLGGALLTMRYLYGLWRARKLDQLMADPQGIMAPSHFDKETSRYVPSGYRARTFDEAQAAYMKPSRNGMHHEDHLGCAAGCAAVWPGVWLVLGLHAVGVLLMEGLAVFAARSTRKPLAQLRAEREAAECASQQKAAAQAQRIAELERELGLGYGVGP